MSVRSHQDLQKKRTLQDLERGHSQIQLSGSKRPLSKNTKQYPARNKKCKVNPLATMGTGLIPKSEMLQMDLREVQNIPLDDSQLELEENKMDLRPNIGVNFNTEGVDEPGPLDPDPLDPNFGPEDSVQRFDNLEGEDPFELESLARRMNDISKK